MKHTRSVEFRPAAAYRVLVEGVVTGAYDDYHLALQDAYAAAIVRTEVMVEVIGGSGLRIVVAGDTPVDPPVDPEEPVDPDDGPDTPEDPELPVDPPPPVEYDGDHPFYGIAATMEPGEFRRVSVTDFPPGVDNMQSMNSTNWYDGAGGTSGVGWTDRHVFDQTTGRLYNVLLREDFGRSVTWLNPDLTMDGVPVGEEAGFTRRRPFNRLCAIDGYLYFAPSIPDTLVGRLTRAHVTTPGDWEDVGAPPLPGSTNNAADGAFSLSYHEDLGKFVFYIYGTGRGERTPEGIHDFEQGRVYTWGIGDDAWVFVGRTQSCGFAGTTIYNPVRREVLIWGGSTQYSSPHPLGGECLATLDADGALHRHGPCGLFYSAGNRRLGYHPITGDYILLDQEPGGTRRNRIWIGDPPRGRPWRLMHLHERSEVFSGYDVWHRVCPLPRTDVLIWSDSIRGIILHKPLSWADLEGAEEIPIPVIGESPSDPDDAPGDDPEDEPDDPVVEIPDPPVEPVSDLSQTALVLMGERLAPGETVALAPRLPVGDNWQAFRSLNTHAPDVTLPHDMTTWGGKGQWDRGRMTMVVLGDRTPLGSVPRLALHAYDASIHALGHRDLGSLLGPLADPARVNEPGKAHPYGQTALDDALGHFYYAPLPDQIRRYHLDDDAWEIIPVDAAGAAFGPHSPLMVHEGLGMLIVADQQVGASARLRGWADGDSAWRDLGEIGHDGYQASAVYSRVRGDALMLGGNHAGRAVTLITATGDIRHLSPAPDSVDGLPLSLGISARNISTHPATGDYLLLDSHARALFSFNPDRDHWSLVQSWADAPGWPGPYEGHLLVPIDGTDLSIWYSRHAPRIYRHTPAI